MPDDPAQREQMERELGLLEEAARFLASARNIDEIYPVIVRSAALILAGGEFKWRASYLALEGDVLRPLAVHDTAGIQLGERVYRLREYPALRQVVETAEPLYGDAVALSAGIPADTQDAVARAGIVATAMLPVAHSGEVFGVLSVTAREVAEVEDMPFHRLRAVANLAALAIANARLIARQEDVAARAQAVERSKARFLNLAAHEMRGPLTVLRGYVSMLADGSLGPLTSDMGRALGMLQSKADEMNRLVNEMLETARFDEARLELNLEPLDLRDVATAAVDGLRPLIGEAHQVVLLGRGEPLPVSGDASRLTTLVTNLLDNAAKYSAPGTPVEVRCERRSGSAVVAVTDQGIGLSEEDETVLFTRFGRIVSAETSHLPGTGLGLWLSREIARMHGGDIHVASRKGVGSTFTLILPLDFHDR